jgi:hypothetical protein
MDARDRQEWITEKRKLTESVNPDPLSLPSLVTFQGRSPASLSSLKLCSPTRPDLWLLQHEVLVIEAASNTSTTSLLVS